MEFKEVHNLVEKLFIHTFIDSPSENNPIYYKYYLDLIGNNEYFLDLINILFNDPTIQSAWSLDAIKDHVSRLISELGKEKENNQKLANLQQPDLEKITQKFLEGFQNEFEEKEYFTIIHKLQPEVPLTIGTVTFWPMKDRKDEIMKDRIFTTYPNLVEKGNCLASSRIKVEFSKGAEILLKRVVEALNILRYIGALVWYNESSRQLYIAGGQHIGVHDVFTLDPVELMGWVGDNYHNPKPFYVDGNFLTSADNFHFREISSWLENPTPLQRSVILAIQWFGDATRELNPEQAFMKYYIAIEILLKKKDESAKNTLPDRLMYILRKKDQNGLKQYFKGLIDRRNDVFHEGKLSQRTPETIAKEFHQYSRDVINNIVQHMHMPHIFLKGPKTGWDTKEELIDCIDARSKEVNMGRE